jgi:hypothetical protein
MIHNTNKRKGEMMNVKKMMEQFERKLAKCPKFYAHWRTTDGEMVTKSFQTCEELRTFCDGLLLVPYRCFSVRHSGDVQTGMTVSFFGNVNDADKYAEHLRNKHKTPFVTVHCERTKKMIGDFSQRD